MGRRVLLVSPLYSAGSGRWTQFEADHAGEASHSRIGPALVSACSSLALVASPRRYDAPAVEGGGDARHTVDQRQPQALGAAL
jgi:hypothetical protein